MLGVRSRVVVAEAGTPHSGPDAVSLDGRSWPGPLAARANKPGAQYVGAAARAAEQASGHAEIEQDIVAAEASRTQASGEEAAAAGGRRG